ncbi:MAG: hypothetical protein BEN18_11355 [Epulopiscium sp. Nuni2H_MBin001]|nr:MAG: hypothetical protein BEN18_11355 [Epulopiscium sp. Nuni2H_MBin001]
MKKIKITTEYITLSELLKYAAFVNTGGEAKCVIKQGLVLVNGDICEMRGKKLRKGDTVQFNQNICTIL